MWPHARVAWWDAKRTLAMRGRRIIAAVALTTAAGAGLGVCDHRSQSTHQSDPSRSNAPPATQTPAVEPTIPWPIH